MTPLGIFLFHVLKFVLFGALNMIIVSIMYGAVRDIKQKQKVLLNKNSAKTRKTEIVFSSMTAAMIIYYCLIALDLYIVFNSKNFWSWLDYLLTPNLKVIIIAQFSALIALGQISPEDLGDHGYMNNGEKKLFGSTIIAFMINMTIYSLL